MTDMGGSRRIELRVLSDSNEHFQPRLPGLNDRNAVKLPTSRAECRGPGLCPKLGCKYNLTIDVSEAGSIGILGESQRLSVRVINGVMYVYRNSEGFDERVLDKLDEMEVNCALDIAEASGMTVDKLAERMGVTRAGIQLVIKKAIRKLKADPEARKVLRALLDEYAQSGGNRGDGG